MTPAAAAALLESAEPWFFERGAAAGYLMLGELLPRRRSSRSWRSCWPTPRPPAGTSTGCRTGWTSVTNGSAADTVVRDWRNPRAAALMIRAAHRPPDAESARAVELCEQAVALESDGPGRSIALMALGNAFARDGRFADAADILLGSWRQRDHPAWSPGVTLQIAGNLGLSLLRTRPVHRPRRLPPGGRSARRRGRTGVGRGRRSGAGDAPTRAGPQPLSAGRRRGRPARC